jgi:hypothetical protein
MYKAQKENEIKLGMKIDQNRNKTFRNIRHKRI